MPEMSQEESEGDYQYLQRTDSHHSGRKSVTIYMKASRRKNGVISNGKMEVKTIPKHRLCLACKKYSKV